MAYTLSPASVTKNEADGTVTFTLTRSGAFPAETVYVSTLQGSANGYATNSGDYVGKLNEALTFSSGQTSKTITVSITNDSVVESSETFGLIVQRNSTDPVTTYLEKSTFTIADDDTGGDTTAPTLVTKSPADESSNVVISSNIVLTFDEAVQAGSGSLTLTNLGTGGTRTIAVTDTSQVTFNAAAKTMTINPTADLLAGAQYQVTFGSGVVKDLAGNSFAGLAAGALNFTTAAAAIYLEGKPLGDGDYGHLYLVYRDITGTEYHIAGFAELGQIAGFGAIIMQAGGLLSESGDARNGLTPSERGQIKLDLGGRQAADVWSALVDFANDIHSERLDYDIVL